MANTYNSIASPQNAVLGHAQLTATTACTTRGPTATAGLAAANIVVCIPTCPTDTKISRIDVKGISTSMTAPTAAQLVGIWMWDGTEAHLVDEIVVTALTPSTTVPSFSTYTLYDDFILPATYALYVSTTVTTTASTTAILVVAHGAAM